MTGEASTGRETINRRKELRPDITLMDLQMPEMSGIEAVGHQNSICTLNQVVTVRKNESMFGFVLALAASLQGLLLSRHQLNLENLALRQQLTVLKHRQPRPRLRR